MSYTADSAYTITQAGDNSSILSLPTPTKSDIVESADLGNNGDIQSLFIRLKKNKIKYHW